MQRERDPNAAMRVDFVEVVSLAGAVLDVCGRCRLIANAGGLNPQGCARSVPRAFWPKPDVGR